MDRISTVRNIPRQEPDSHELSVIQNIFENSNSALRSISVTHIRRYHHSSSQDEASNDQRHQKHTKDIRSDETGMIEDHHRISKKHQKKICSRRCIIASILIALIISIILAVILSIILIKSKTVTTLNIVPTLRWNTTGITLFGLSGVTGNASDQLKLPKDAILDSPNILYIADSGNHRIQKYVIGDLTGTTLAGQTSGIGGSSASHLNSPSSVLIDSNGGLYVADTNNHRIQFWSNGVSSGITIVGNGTNGFFNMTNQLSQPYGIYRDLNSDILYIPDYGNARVMSYASGASSGIVVAGGKGSGRNNTQLYSPIRVYFDALSNSLVIANHNAHNIVRWVLGDSSWTILAGNLNGTLGNSSTELRFPSDVTFDPMGNMYVADKDNYRIQLFMAGQSEGRTIAGVTRISGNTSTLLFQPWSVKLDNQLNLYVADSRNHRIQKFLRY
ncbi:unnamed protein product [Rotaria sordida]|uniref:NHL repeat-containing protein n=1 Tax=Rotaria sordida TaxID=392033 RepID=A0A815GB04_9BILA|nr:unnamed protein product [Rotaria sordida]CAF1594466.1 unnamed protein product [Rotaria sordida]